MMSLRKRLFLQAALVTILVWAVAAAWATYSTKSKIEHALDNRLKEAAGMVASLGSVRADTNGATIPPLPVGDNYSRQLSCQIWSVTGRLISRSDTAPTAALARHDSSGFSDRTIGGVGWRVYTLVVPQSGVRVMVGDTLAMRRNLLTHLILGLVIPAIIGIFALAALLWISIGGGLSPLNDIAATIEGRGADDLSPLGIERVPPEMTVVTQAIDGAFAGLAGMRERERRFLASAAHEMQTPLAGLKMQADIAGRTDDPAVRRKALSHIAASIARTTRLVRQLLELTRQQAGSMPPVAAEETRIAPLLGVIGNDLSPLLADRGVTVAPTDDAMRATVPLGEDVLLLVLRNLIENAASYGPAGGTVTVGVAANGVYVEDQGEGMSEAMIADVRQHFIRGRTDVQGSGLGLAIVDTALTRAGARVEFSRMPETGFRATIVTRVRLAPA
ncbi:sensor histidine kinase [Stakelama marina]|uniref:histidine kinase n=1 Tax=Stakelama marina TaxID=2826939 RepID=A0A8T4ID62_9SPHN|nr:sensor histidine kinase [Stakelama marina]MBR0552587.1 sensor histidine kinase N-terminal domain-containing protein [Stakelama marina]